MSISAFGVDHGEEISKIGLAPIKSAIKPITTKVAGSNLATNVKQSNFVRGFKAQEMGKPQMIPNSFSGIAGSKTQKGAAFAVKHPTAVKAGLGYGAVTGGVGNLVGRKQQKNKGFGG